MDRIVGSRSHRIVLYSRYYKLYVSSLPPKKHYDHMTLLVFLSAINMYTVYARKHGNKR